MVLVCRKPSPATKQETTSWWRKWGVIPEKTWRFKIAFNTQQKMIEMSPNNTFPIKTLEYLKLSSTKSDSSTPTQGKWLTKWSHRSVKKDHNNIWRNENNMHYHIPTPWKHQGSITILWKHFIYSGTGCQTNQYKSPSDVGKDHTARQRELCSCLK